MILCQCLMYVCIFAQDVVRGYEAVVWYNALCSVYSELYSDYSACVYNLQNAYIFIVNTVS